MARMLSPMVFWRASVTTTLAHELDDVRMNNAVTLARAVSAMYWPPSTGSPDPVLITGNEERLYIAVKPHNRKGERRYQSTSLAQVSNTPEKTVRTPPLP